jgi:hypothetical protein
MPEQDLAYFNTVLNTAHITYCLETNLLKISTQKLAIWHLDGILLHTLATTHGHIYQCHRTMSRPCKALWVLAFLDTKSKVTVQQQFLCTYSTDSLNKPQILHSSSEGWPYLWTKQYLKTFYELRKSQKINHFYKACRVFLYCEFIKNIYVPLLLTQLELKIWKRVPYA